MVTTEEVKDLLTWLEAIDNEGDALTVRKMLAELEALRVTVQFKEYEAAGIRSAMGRLNNELEALRAIATAAEWYKEDGFEYCPICGSSDNVGHDTQCLYTQARAAGYLGEEVGG